MGCIIEFSESLLRFEFNSKGANQKILVDMLLKYGDLDIDGLALALDTSINELQDILNDNHFFVGEQAHDLSQLFLVFFGRRFFNKFTLIRNFC